jgi:Protein of unknown function (DUF732)
MGSCGPTPEGLPPVRRKVHGAVMAWVRTGVICAVAVSAWLPTAVAAKADSSSDFLAMLSAGGLNVGDTPADVQLTLYEGDAICHLLYWGYTPQVAARQVPYAFPNATPAQVTGFVHAAQTTLCGTMFTTPLQTGGDY